MAPELEINPNYLVRFIHLPSKTIREFEYTKISEAVRVIESEVTASHLRANFLNLITDGFMYYGPQTSGEPYAENMAFLFEYGVDGQPLVIGRTIYNLILDAAVMNEFKSGTGRSFFPKSSAKEFRTSGP